MLHFVLIWNPAKQQAYWDTISYSHKTILETDFLPELNLKKNFEVSDR